MPAVGIMQFDQDISWIRFNARVLHEAQDPRTPLLERVKFLQIFTTNLDEFFMKRIGRLRVHRAGVPQLALSPSASDLLNESHRLIFPLLQQQAECWSCELVPALKHNGIEILDWPELTSREQESMENYFDKNIFPVLTPLSMGPGLPFPFISNLSSSIGVLLQQKDFTLPSFGSFNGIEGGPSGEEPVFTRIKIPPFFPQWICLNPGRAPSEGMRLVSLRNVVQSFMGKLFPGMEMSGFVSFRVTRNAIVESEEEDVEDLLEMVTEELRERRFGEVVRLEISPPANALIRELLKNELTLDEQDIYPSPSDVDFSQMNPITELKLPALKYRPWKPVTPKILQEHTVRANPTDQEQSLFNVLKNSDLLVHHPYESFADSVENFVRSAAYDPKVLAIKMTLYRTGVNSPFIPLLIHAAETGKQVVCLVELQARFDEERNIHVAHALEEAGVHVVYGIVGLKTHCKVTLVVRRDEDQIRSYAHIGTGNYHSVTSALYTDQGLFTANPEITEDLTQLFHFLTGRSLNQTYKKLLVAPIQMKAKFLNLIQFETQEALEKRPARILAKMNNLEDPDIIQALYRASAAGVEIDLIIRGFCCLIPQKPGLSERIRVISVIGRFLEHCRIFYFQNGAKEALDGRFYIGSADWMTRNMESRIEAIAPIENSAHRARLYQYLQILLKDQRQAWDLDETGHYEQRKPTNQETQEGTHERLMNLYRKAPLGMPAPTELKQCGTASQKLFESADWA